VAAEILQLFFHHRRLSQCLGKAQLADVELGIECADQSGLGDMPAPAALIGHLVTGSDADADRSQLLRIEYVADGPAYAGLIDDQLGLVVAAAEGWPGQQIGDALHYCRIR
jgi:hypothetical protein